MASTIEIINGISQVLASTYDGATDEDGKPLKTGLKRELDVPFTDRRVIDGFKVKMTGNKLRLNYQTEVLLNQVHDKKFEDEIVQTISDVVSFLKKEYKKVTGNTLTLKEIEKPVFEMHNTSRVRISIDATCLYEVGGVDTNSEDKTLKDLDKAVKDWLQTGKQTYSGAKKAKNDER